MIKFDHLLEQLLARFLMGPFHWLTVLLNLSNDLAIECVAVGSVSNIMQQSCKRNCQNCSLLILIQIKLMVVVDQ
jgi:Na+/serine symporter